MKSKNFKKKLTLNKKTIADLNILEMKDIYGGMDKPGISNILRDTGCGCPSFTCVPSGCSGACC